MSSLPELVERLADLTEEHVRSATQLDVGRMQTLTDERADLQFELRLLLREHAAALDGEDKLRTREATLRLAAAERRFERVVGVVVRGLGGDGKSPETYDPSGRLGGQRWG